MANDSPTYRYCSSFFTTVVLLRCEGRPAGDFITRTRRSRAVFNPLTVLTRFLYKNTKIRRINPLLRTR